MSVSVVMCTYNGAKYIEEQLNSILSQDMWVDEIIIQDDCSNDTTKEILECYSRKYDNISVYFNNTNLGYRRNFKSALALAKNEYIFLCDQDDIWENNRVSLSIKQMNKDNLDVVFSNAFLINQYGEVIDKCLWDNISFSPDKDTDLFYELVKRNCSTGATMCIRKTLYDKYSDIPLSWVHDGWFTMCACLNNKLGYIDEKLIRYRQHDSNQIGAKKKTFGSFLKSLDKEKYINSYVEKEERYNSILKFINDDSKKTYVQCGINFYNDRVKVLNKETKSKLHILLKHLFKSSYKRYTNGCIGFVTDVLLMVKER